MDGIWPRAAVCAAALVCTGGLWISGAPPADATVCGSVGGRFVDVTGCSDPFYELNDALGPPPPPNVTVCANVGRRINVSVCT